MAVTEKLVFFISWNYKLLSYLYALQGIMKRNWSHLFDDDFVGGTPALLSSCGMKIRTHTNYFIVLSDNEGRMNFFKNSVLA